MVALPKTRHHAQPLPAAAPPRRHLRLVTPPEPARASDEESRRVREARWTAVLVATATAVFFALWTAAMLGAADEAWWAFALALVLVGMVGLGVVVIRKAH